MGLVWCIFWPLVGPFLIGAWWANGREADYPDWTVRP